MSVALELSQNAIKGLADVDRRESCNRMITGLGRFWFLHFVPAHVLFHNQLFRILSQIEVTK